MTRIRPLINKLEQSIRSEIGIEGITRHDAEQAFARALDKLDQDGAFNAGKTK
jgi:hypothetical protein